jgi:NADH-quinone oxidoreductase subunit M
VAAVVAVLGIVLSALYILVVVQRVSHGPETENVRGMSDLLTREAFVVAPVVALIIAVGVYPKPLFDVVNPATDRVLEYVDATPVVPDVPPSQVADEGGETP